MKLAFYYLVFVISPMISFAGQKDSIPEPDILKVGVKNTPPFIIKDNNTYKGISIDLWESIAKRTGYKYVYEEYSLDELLTKLIDGEIDICINPLTVTSDRLKQFDFTQPFYKSNLAIAVRKDHSTFFSNFFSENLLKVIGLILIVILFFGFFLWLIEKPNYPDSQKKGGIGLMIGWLKASSIILSSRKSRSIETGTGNFISLLGGLIVIFIICGYTAASFFKLSADRNIENTFGPEALKEIKVASLEASAPLNYLKINGIEPIEYPTLAELLEALETGEVQAIVYDEPILRYEIHKQEVKEVIRILPHQFNDQYYGFSAPENSNILKQINPELFDIFESNEWDTILNQYNLHR